MKAIKPFCSKFELRSHCQKIPCVRAQASNAPNSSRRETLQKIFVLPAALPALWNASQRPALAIEPVAASDVPAPPAPPKLKAYIARDFFFQYNPEQFKIVEDPADLNTPPGGRRGENPVRAELAALDGIAKVTVVQSQAAKLKQTLFQVTDISQLGSPQEVVRLLLPPTTKVLATSVRTYAQPPRNTGTVMGVIERDPVQIYRYEVILPSGQHAEVAVGALLGRILLLGASTAEEKWDETRAERLRAIADTFKLLPK